VEDTTVNSQNGWVVIVLAAVALAVVAEIFILLKVRPAASRQAFRAQSLEHSLMRCHSECPVQRHRPGTEHAGTSIPAAAKAETR